MNIIVELHHPGDPLFFQHPVAEWLVHGHQVTLINRDRGPMKQLVEALYPPPDGASFQVRTASRIARSNRLPLLEAARRHTAVTRAMLTRHADAVVSLFGVYAQTAWLLRKPNVVFTDSEFQRFAHRIAHPFATAVVTPRCYRLDEGKKHVRYDGYHELAYLHPRRFSARPERALAEAGLDGRRPLCVVRFSDFNTSHDMLLRGLGEDERRDLVRRLRNVCDVVISFEGEPDEALRALCYKGPVERLHHLIAAAELCVSEGATVASEAAVLGVPTIFINPTSRCYLDEQRDRYALCTSARNYQEALPLVADMLYRLELEREAVRAEWRASRARMLEDVIDVASFARDFVEQHVAERSGSTAQR
ncbi:MAG: DUF354 domain-containing protein [Myxococcales bacterium]|nr:DUF354 domain-containing protein [Myxococcales bacterium]